MTEDFREETVGDALEAFEALMDEINNGTTQTIPDGTAEHVDVDEAFENLLIEDAVATSTEEEATDNAEIIPETTIATNIGTIAESALSETTEDTYSTYTAGSTSSSIYSDYMTALSSVDLSAVGSPIASNSSMEAEHPATTEEALVVPINDRETLMEDTTARFRGASWFNKVKSQSVTIVGQGGIGSWTSLIVGRLGVYKLLTYDDDIVEEVNMAGQMFGRDDIGNSKCSSVYYMVNRLCGYISCNFHNRRFMNGDFVSPITIGALDNMNTRKELFQTWKASWGTNPEALFIDGRLSADEFQIFVIPGNNLERANIYETKWLFNQEEGEHTQCSFKQTTYMATMIASFIGNMIVNHCANLVDADAMFDLPFYINYNSEMGYFKTSEV